jgi:type IV pilus assembly protein PilW
MPLAVQGTSASDTTATCLLNRLAGLPALTVRHASVDATSKTSTMVGGNLYLQVSRCTDDTRQIVASTIASDFTLKNIACAGIIDELRRFEVRSYYVASCSDCSAGDTLPTLKRAELVDGAIRLTPIAEGIEKLAFEYGIDSDGDGRPDEFIDTSLVNGTPVTRAWQNVVSVRITLLARARNATAGYVDPRTYTIAGVDYAPADGYKRVLLTSTVRLVNVGGRLE